MSAIATVANLRIGALGGASLVAGVVGGAVGYYFAEDVGKLVQQSKWFVAVGAGATALGLSALILGKRF
jgi:hypothetical protein